MMMIIIIITIVIIIKMITITVTIGRKENNKSMNKSWVFKKFVYESLIDILLKKFVHIHCLITKLKSNSHTF